MTKDNILVELKRMANQNILIEKDRIKPKGGVVVLDLEKYQELDDRLEEYKEKEKILRNLDEFEKLAKWGRNFAQEKKITPEQVLDND